MLTVMLLCSFHKFGSETKKMWPQRGRGSHLAGGCGHQLGAVSVLDDIIKGGFHKCMFTFIGRQKRAAWQAFTDPNLNCYPSSHHHRHHLPSPNSHFLLLLGPSLALIHSAGMSVWRQAVVCAPGMRNLTSGLEFKPPNSSSRFSQIRRAAALHRQKGPERQRQSGPVPCLALCSAVKRRSHSAPSDTKSAAASASEEDGRE